jgi:hypothetical protein
MRRRIVYLLVGVVSPLVLGACANQPPKDTQLDGAAIIEAYRQGIAEAITELRNNSPTIYTTTTPSMPNDPDTNFPYRQFNGPTTPLQLWRLLGHNDFVRGYVGANLGRPVPH